MCRLAIYPHPAITFLSFQPSMCQHWMMDSLEYLLSLGTASSQIIQLLKWEGHLVLHFISWLSLLSSFSHCSSLTGEFINDLRILI